MCDTKKVLLNFHVLKFSYNYTAAEKNVAYFSAGAGN